VTAITRQPAFWVAYGIASLIALLAALRLFPLAIPIVNLDITTSRDEAIAAANTLATKLHIAPDGARVAARFAHDAATQNYVELEGGGKPAFATLTRGDRYSPYWWEVRLFTLGAIDETVIRLKPDGAPYGFARRLPETYVHDAAGKALDQDAARAIAETRAREDWGIDFSAYRLLEHSQRTQTSGRVDHSFTYERPEALGDARIRLLLVVSGDEFTGLAPFVHIPEAFVRRYEELRSTNNLIATLASVTAGIVYGIGGCILGVLWLARKHWLVWRPPVVAGLIVGTLLALASLASSGSSWFGADTTETVTTFWSKQIAMALLIAVGGGLGYALVFMTAEGLTRRAFPQHLQLWKLWSRDGAASPQVAGRTLGGYLFVPLELALVAAFYYATNRWLGWWQPSEVLTDPNILGSSMPALTPIAISLQAGFWEECFFRAIPLSLGALIGDRYGHRTAGIAIAVVLQALVFGSAHANYPGFPSYSRAVELFVPSIVWALIYLRFGLLTTVLLPATFDLTLFSIPVFLVDAPGARAQQALIIAAALVPAAIVVFRRWQAHAWREWPDALRNAAWQGAAPKADRPPAQALAAGRWSTAFQRALPVLAVLGIAAWAVFAPFHADVAPLRLSRAEAIDAANQALVAQRVTLGPEWQRFAAVKLASEDPAQWLWHKFVWQQAGEEAYRRLVGNVLAPPGWEVRYARFEGDVAERAEEWRVAITDDRRVRAMSHLLPEQRAGERLSRDDALALAERALRTRFDVDAKALTLVAADEQQRPARTDWSFVFGDPRIVVGSGGEARYVVGVSGGEVTGAGRFVHVPEAFTRNERERDNRLQVLGIAAVFVIIGAAVAALGVGIVGWIKHRVDSKLLGVVFAIMFGVALLTAINGWPALAMRLSTTEPLATQLTTKILGALAATLLGSLLVALCAGVGAFGARATLPITRIGRWPAWSMAVAAGAFVVGVQVALSALATSDVPQWPSSSWESQAIPVAGGLLSGVSFLAVASLELFVVYVVSRITHGFSQRLWLAVIIVIALECAAALVTGRSNLAGAFIAGAISGVTAAAVLLLLLRYDARLVPSFAATVVLMTGAVKAAQAAAWFPFAFDALTTVLVCIALTRYLNGSTREPTAPA
jgi:hypothetical protein